MPYSRAKNGKKASKTAVIVQAAVSLFMEEHDSRNQTHSLSVSDNPFISIHSHSTTFHWNNTHHSNTKPIASQVHDVSMPKYLTLNVAMVESLPEIDLCSSSIIEQGGISPHYSPNGIIFPPIPHKASCIATHQL